LFSFLILFALTTGHASSPPRPRELLLTVRKDAATQQYVTVIRQRTPEVPVKLVVDLGGQFLWVDCDRNYISSSLRNVRCNTAECNLAGNSVACGNNGTTCSVFPGSPFLTTIGDLVEDVVSVASTDGTNPGPYATVPRFAFACGSTALLHGLARGATGIAGLGRSRIGVPLQFAADFSFGRKFAICLSSSTAADGVIFIGGGPYNLISVVPGPLGFQYTPLYVNPVSTAGTYTEGEKSTEYFIGVRSITLDINTTVPINGSLLKIDKKGYGGTKISTVNSYTVLETSIYRSLTSAFVRASAARGIRRVPGVAPFEFCFSAGNIGSTRVGPAVPYINLELDGADRPIWTIFGSNSMVSVKNDAVLCLGFLNGGANPRTAIVIGGYQIEDNLLQFDLDRSRLGFSSTLLGRETTCANFNFTVTS
ncbi:hypothetical protein M569_01796, partial [Genlisea aurea]